MDDHMLGFLVSMYLECVSNAKRTEFLLESGLWNTSPAHVLERFRQEIQSKSYVDLLNKFKALMNAKMAILFQERNRKPLNKDTKNRDIILLDRSDENEKERIGILRSELLRFHEECECVAGQMVDTPCSSTLLLNIQDEVKIVKVSDTQHDPLVDTYSREPCVICYIRLHYCDSLDGAEKYIYLAFFYKSDGAQNLMNIIQVLRKLLAFRDDIVTRISKDFSGNLYGRQKEAEWSNAWLSIEKAGAHTDKSKTNHLIKELNLDKSSIIPALFGLGPECTGENNKETIIELLFNIEISMYYRAVISEGEHIFQSNDNIIEMDSDTSSRYYQIGDFLHFPAAIKRIVFDHDSINDACLYGEESICEVDCFRINGMPVIKELTVRKRYLRAFIVDILKNMLSHEKQNLQCKIYLEEASLNCCYLVFANEVICDDLNMNVSDWCAKKNYELKQAAEFDHQTDPDAPKGISLGCIAHCMNQYGQFQAFFSVQEYSPGKRIPWYYIKLPIIKNKTGGI